MAPKKEKPVKKEKAPKKEKPIKSPKGAKSPKGGEVTSPPESELSSPTQNFVDSPEDRLTTPPPDASSDLHIQLSSPQSMDSINPTKPVSSQEMHTATAATVVTPLVAEQPPDRAFSRLSDSIARLPEPVYEDSIRKESPMSPEVPSLQDSLPLMRCSISADDPPTKEESQRHREMELLEKCATLTRNLSSVTKNLEDVKSDYEKKLVEKAREIDSLKKQLSKAIAATTLTTKSPEQQPVSYGAGAGTSAVSSPALNANVNSSTDSIIKDLRGQLDKKNALINSLMATIKEHQESYKKVCQALEYKEEEMINLKKGMSRQKDQIRNILSSPSALTRMVSPPLRPTSPASPAIVGSDVDPNFLSAELNHVRTLLSDKTTEVKHLRDALLKAAPNGRAEKTLQERINELEGMLRARDTQIQSLTAHLHELRSTVALSAR